MARVATLETKVASLESAVADLKKADSEFSSKLAILENSIKQNQDAMICNYHKPDQAPSKTKIVSISQIDGLRRVPVAEAKMGDIIRFSGADAEHLCSDVTVKNLFIQGELVTDENVLDNPSTLIGKNTENIRFTSDGTLPESIAALMAQHD